MADKLFKYLKLTLLIIVLLDISGMVIFSEPIIKNRGVVRGATSNPSIKSPKRRKRLTEEERYKYFKPDPKLLEKYAERNKQMEWVVDEYLNGRAGHKDAYFASMVLRRNYELGGDIEKSDEYLSIAEGIKANHPDLADLVKGPHRMSLSPEILEKIGKHFYPKRKWYKKDSDEYHKSEKTKKYKDNKLQLKYKNRNPKVKIYRFRIEFYDDDGRIVKVLKFDRNIRFSSISQNGKFIAIYPGDMPTDKDIQIEVHNVETKMLSNFMGVISDDGEIIWKFNKKDLEVHTYGQTNKEPFFNCFDFVSNDGRVISNTRECGSDSPTISLIAIVYPNKLHFLSGYSSMRFSRDGKYFVSWKRRIRKNNTPKTLSLFRLDDKITEVNSFTFTGQIGCSISGTGRYIFCIDYDRATDNKLPRLLLDHSKQLWRRDDLPRKDARFNKDDSEILFSNRYLGDPVFKINSLTGEIISTKK